MEGLSLQNGAIRGNLWTFRSRGLLRSLQVTGRCPPRAVEIQSVPLALFLYVYCVTRSSIMYHSTKPKAVGPSVLDVEQGRPRIQILTTLVRSSLQRKANSWKGQYLDFGQGLM